MPSTTIVVILSVLVIVAIAYIVKLMLEHKTRQEDIFWGNTKKVPTPKRGVHRCPHCGSSSEWKSD